MINLIKNKLDENTSKSVFDYTAFHARAYRLDDWEGSPNYLIKGMNASSKGQAGQDLVEYLAKSSGCSVYGAENKGHDLIIEETKVEVKTATSSSKGHYGHIFLINQIRPKHDFEWLVFVLITPNSLEVWQCPRSYYIDTNNEAVSKQHMGLAGSGETLMVRFEGNPPAGTLLMKETYV